MQNRITPNIPSERKKYWLPAAATTIGGNILLQNINANTTRIITQAIARENAMRPSLRRQLPTIQPGNMPVGLQKIDNAMMGHASSHAVHIGHLSMNLHFSRSLFWQFGTTPFMLFFSAWLTKEDKAYYAFHISGKAYNIKFSHFLIGLGILLMAMNLAFLFLGSPFGLLLATTILGMVSASIQITRSFIALINIWKAWKSNEISSKRALFLSIMQVASIAMNGLTLGMLGSVLHSLNLITTIAAGAFSSLNQKIALLKEVAKLSSEQAPQWAQVTSFCLFIGNVCWAFCLIAFSMVKRVFKPSQEANDHLDQITAANDNDNMARSRSK